MKLGELKEYTLSVEEELFNKENIDMPVVVAIEDYFGDTIQAFHMEIEENMVKIEKVLNENISSNVEDYGVKVSSQNTIEYLDELLEVADKDEDDIFDTNCNMIRLQMKKQSFKKSLYEVVLSQTEIKAGRIYVYADSKEEAQDIVDGDIDYYFEVLEDTKEAECMNYDLEIHSVNEVDKNRSLVNINYIDEEEDVYLKKEITKLEVSNMCSSIDLMKDKLKDIIKYRNVNNSVLADLLIDIMDLSSEVKCELDEDNESSRINIEKHINSVQSKIEEFLKVTL